MVQFPRGDQAIIWLEEAILGDGVVPGKLASMLVGNSSVDQK